MTDETGANTANDGGKIDDTHNTDTQDTRVDTQDTRVDTQDTRVDTVDTVEGKDKNNKRSVSFNRDVHVKRFGKPRESRGSSAEPTVRKEPFTHLSEQELIDEANKVLAQAQSITCTADHPPDKFFSLPHRRKFKEDNKRRNSDDTTPEGKTPLGRSTSDVSARKRKERTSLSTLFRRAQRNRSPVEPVVVATKPIAVVKRSKSDVTDLKSNTTLNTQSKPIRKRSGSETEEFLKSLRNKKAQLSPIIESSPREDYFKKTPPLEVFQKQKLAQKDSNKFEDKKINPVEKPPRYKTPEKDPKPPARTKRGKSADKDKEPSPPIADTPKRKTDVKKTLLVDEIDSIKTNPIELKDKIKESIRKIEENVYADRDMIHSSQQPPDKPPLTRGHTVDHIVKILREDQMSPPPRSHLISPANGTNNNRPFSYIKPSVSPDGNLYVHTSPDRIPSPVNKMDKGVVYAQVIKDDGKHDKDYTNSREKYSNLSDEDEGLGYEDRYKYNIRYDNEYKNNDNIFNNIEDYKITDRPRFREYKLTSFDEVEPTYANEYPLNDTRDFIDDYRGRADGMDTIKKSYEHETSKVDLDFNELSHRRKLLESRINARRFDRERIEHEPITRYITETDPIYEAEKRMKATEKYVNETARYYRHTLERDGFTDHNETEEYNKYDSDNQKIKYNTEKRTYHKAPKGEIDRREYIDALDSRYKNDHKEFPPEPEYEPPSLESNVNKPIHEYREKKYKIKKHITSSHDALQTGQKYKRDEEYFGKRKGHYSSNPEIAQEREDDYANLPRYGESYHNSLRREKKDRYKEDYGIRRHDSGDSRDYYDRSPSRFDNRLVDSGIENDFRKDSSGEIHRRTRRYESDEDVRNTSMFLDSERRHTEDNYPGEQIYANTEHLKYKHYKDNGYLREPSADGSRYDPKLERYEKSPSRIDEKISAKPPKTKKLSGLEKMKQLFSRDSSKKSKKEKEVVQPKTRTRVLKSPEHLARDDSDYRRYTDPEPSDIIVKKVNYECLGDERRMRGSREDVDRYRSPETRDSDVDRKHREYDDRYRSPEVRDSDLERRHREYDDKYRREPDIRDSDTERKHREYDDRYERKVQERRYQEYREENRRYNSSERESDRPSDGEVDRRKTRSRTRPMDSPALAERYKGRRRLATPSPTPSPPRRAPPAPAPAPTGWFKSLDRLTRRKGKQEKIEKESITEDEAARKVWSKPKSTLNSPAKNLRFFGDSDQDSVTHTTVTKSKSHPHTTLRKTTSNSTGVDEIDSSLANKSYSLTNLKEDNRHYKRNLQNISENHSNSENESQFGKSKKPPISPYNRSRSQSSSKTLKPERGSVSDGRRPERGVSDVRRVETGSNSDVRRIERSSNSDVRRIDRGSNSDVRRIDRGSNSDVRRIDRGSNSDVRRTISSDVRRPERGSSSDVRRDRGSSTELRSKERDLKHRRRAAAPHSGESSTEGDSSHHSQRSVVYLHATTVGDIPDPTRLIRRSRDDVSSVNSSNLQVRSTTKSFSIFAPWTPRPAPDHRDLHYAQQPRKQKKEIKKASSTKTLNDDRSTLQKNKSYSQTTLTKRPTSSRLTSSNNTLYRKDKHESQSTLRKPPKDTKKSQSSEIISRDDDRERISRSLSMPKDKKAGWFKMTNKNKKPEVNSRVR